MTEKRIPNIKFHSVDDLARGQHLSEAEVFLKGFNPDEESNLDQLFECYNIKLYFEHQLYPANWNEAQKAKGTGKVDDIYKILKARLLAITEENFEQELSTIDRRYHSDFWKLVTDLGVIKHLSPQALTSLFNTDDRHIYHVLAQRRIVDKFDRTLRNFLLGYSNSAQMILKQLEEGNNGMRKPMFLPKSLGPEDKEAVIEAHLDGEEPNLNYVRLIEHARGNDLKLSPKTKLKAKRKSDELTGRIFRNGNSWSVGVAVSFSTEQEEPVTFTYHGSELEAIYSEPFIDNFTNDPDLFEMLKFLFLFTDSSDLVNLVSKETELTTLERILMRSRNEYSTGVAFYRKESLSTIQIAILDHYLKRKGKSIESIINGYVQHINTCLSEHELRFLLPIDGASYLQK